MSEADRHIVVTGVIAFGVFAHVAGTLVLTPSSVAAHRCSDLFWTTASFLASVRCLCAARVSPSPAGRAWLLFGIGQLTWFVTMLWWSCREIFHDVSAPVLDLVSSAFGIMPLMFTIGLRSFRANRDANVSAKRRHTLTRDEWLDGASALLFVILVWVSLLYVPIAQTPWSGIDLVPVTVRGFFYSVALVQAVVVFSHPSNLAPRVARFLLAGLALLAGAYFEFVAVAISGHYDSGRPVDALWTLSFGLFYVAADEQIQSAQRPPRQPLGRVASPMLYVWGLVFLSIAIGLVNYRRLTPANLLLMATFAIVAIMATRADRVLERERLANESSLETLRMREEFLAIAAHELRTPLAPMKMHLWLLARRLREANAAAIDGRLLTENVAGLERSLARLVNLVDHMVDVSQFERGLAQLRREPTNLSELVCETCEEFVDFMPKGNARLRLDVDPDVRAELDAPRIAMVLRELLANASKFSEGKPIDVRLRRMGDAVELSVHDEGIGISAVDQTRIFGKLERAAEASHYGGLGLGLFLARAIIDAHGGSIRVVSEPGRGATFAVFLPVIDTAIDAIDAESVTD